MLGTTIATHLATGGDACDGDNAYVIAAAGRVRLGPIRALAGRYVRDGLDLSGDDSRRRPRVVDSAISLPAPGRMALVAQAALGPMGLSELPTAGVRVARGRGGHPRVAGPDPPEAVTPPCVMVHGASAAARAARPGLVASADARRLSGTRVVPPTAGR